MTSVHFVVLFDGLLLALGGLMAHQGRIVPALSIFGAFGVLALWQTVLASITRSFAGTYRWDSFFRPTHYVQAALHTSLYTYLGLYWEGVARYAPLIVTQIVFGYLCDMLIAWSRGRVWRFGLGVVPIVLSTNLFLWFRESVFFLQLGLMALTFLSKEFITWNYGGRRRHIFNPSAFSLSIVSIILLLTGTVDWAHAVDIAVAFNAPPNYYEVIFLLGLVVQTLFIVTPVSFGAAFGFFLIFHGSQALLGAPISLAPMSPPIFLGITFLVTDPATSPRTHFGRFLFGMAYSVGVMATFMLLRFVHEPSIFDKLLAVPFVNLLVPLIDRLCEQISALWKGAAPLGPGISRNLARFGWIGAYLMLFSFMLPQLKATKTRPVSFLPPPVGRISNDVKRINRSMLFCRQEFPEAYQPFGFRGEIAHASEIRKIYRQGLDIERETADNAPRVIP